MDREIGGIRCSQVLARLGDLLDGELETDVRTRIAAHVAACRECRRFGERYADVVAALRTTDVPPAVATALEARLRSR